MGLIGRLRRNGHVHDEIAGHFRRHFNGSGGGAAAPARILDLPAGAGENAEKLREAGFAVEAADLFPERCQARGLSCTRADMTQRFPYDDASFDGVLHSEGIEHVDDQLHVLGEVARVLKPGGVAIVTTPNILFLQARLDALLSGHPRPKRWLVTEAHGYWGGSREAGESVYFGHVFLINAFQLRFLMTHVGLEVVAVETTRYSSSSVLLAPLLYPLVWWGTKRLWSKSRFHASQELRRRIEREILSPALLFGTKLVMIARKPVGERSGP